MVDNSIICAGIDIGKQKLDVAVCGVKAALQADNTSAGHEKLINWLRRHKVERVGVEATGGYEQAIVRALRREGLVVVVFQPIQVRAYAKFRLKLAKNDKIDAGLIAACVASTDEIRAAPDPRFEAFAAAQTLIDQLTDDIVLYKTRRETAREEHSRAFWEREIAGRKAQARNALKTLCAEMRAHADLAAKLDLIKSVEGIAEKTAIAILIRMPEIGTLSREQVTALAGLAPYDDDSGRSAGTDTSKVAALACVPASTPQPCQRPSFGILSSSPSTNASEPMAKPTKWLSLPVPENSLSSSIPLSPEQPLGSQNLLPANGCSG
jgi:transposase